MTGPPRGAHFIGIDVQVSRGCSYAVLDEDARHVDAGWLPADVDLEDRTLELVERHSDAALGIDAPRQPLPRPRRHYWRGATRKWGPRRSSEKGHGRHCEIAIKAHGIANPQWTPRLADAPEWMRVGFRLFKALETRAGVHEVFPSASYALLENEAGPRLEISFEAFRPGPKDMLDAVIAGLTVLEFSRGRGCEIGGGDGLGTIVLPRPVKNPIPEVLTWPDDRDVDRGD